MGHWICRSWEELVEHHLRSQSLPIDLFRGFWGRLLLDDFVQLRFHLFQRRSVGFLFETKQSRLQLSQRVLGRFVWSPLNVVGFLFRLFRLLRLLVSFILSHIVIGDSQQPCFVEGVAVGCRLTLIGSDGGHLSELLDKFSDHSG